MTPEVASHIAETVRAAEGYAYPNELHLIWSVLIVVYPYVTGLVAGAYHLELTALDSLGHSATRSVDFEVE